MNERTLSAWTGTFSWVGFEHPPTPWNHIFPPLGLKHTNCSPFHTKSSVGLFSFKNRLDLIIPHKLLMGFTWFEISRLLDYTSWLWFMSVSLSAMFCLKGARMSITGCSHFWTIGCGTTVWSFWLGAVGSGSASLNSDMTEIGSWFYASKDWQVVVIFLRFSPWIIATVSTIHHYALLHFLHIYPPQSILWLALNLPTLLFLTSHKLIHSTISKWLCFLFASKFILNQELNFALNCFFFCFAMSSASDDLSYRILSSCLTRSSLIFLSRSSSFWLPCSKLFLFKSVMDRIRTSISLSLFFFLSTNQIWYS